MNIFKEIEKSWNFKKDVKQNILQFNGAREQKRKDNIKKISFSLVLTGIALFFHNPILGLAFIIGSVSYGTGSQWTNSNGTAWSFCCGIDSTHFAVCGQDYNPGGGLWIRIASVSGSTISWGTAYRATTSTSDTPTGISCLDSTHLVFSYYNSNNHYARVAVFSGTTISSEGTVSSGIYVGSVYGYDCALVALSATTFVLTYRDQGGSNYGTAILGTVSTTTISWGTANAFSPNTTSAFAITKIDSTNFVIGMNRYVSSAYTASAVFGTVSGTSLSFGTIADARVGNTASYKNKPVGIATLDSTHIVMSYDSTNMDAVACVASISGTTLTFGTEQVAYTYTSGSKYNYNTSITTFDATHFVIVYYHADSGVSVYANLGTVSGTSITYDGEINFDTSSNADRTSNGACNMFCCNLDGTHIVINYIIGTSNTAYGAIVGTGTFSKTYTLTASQGSIALTGEPTTFHRILTLLATMGTYVLTGIATLLHHVRTMALAYGTYTLTGIATAFKRYLHIITDVGYYTLTGINAILYKGHTLIAHVGSYTLTGFDTLFHTLLHMVATLGTYTLTGIDTLFHKTKVMLAEVGTYVLTGTDTTFHKIIELLATYGTYTLTGIDSTLRKVSTLIAVLGTYTLTGIATGFKKYWKMVSSLGSYTLTGINIGLHKATTLLAVYGTYTLTGISTVFNKYWKMTVVYGIYIYTGVNATLHKVFKYLTATQGSYTLTGEDSLFHKYWKLTTSVGSYILTGFKTKLIAPFHTYWKQKVVSSTDWHKVDRGN